ncbi:MAG: EamA/RhaT family transporter [Denitrovibrio sp.]|nr:MAG: EamA/RhaT family transporter [Denitrovibrio sp.]
MNTEDSKASLLQLTFGAFIISFSPVFAKLSGSATTMSGFYRMFFGLVGLSLMFLLGKKITKCTKEGVLMAALSGVFFSLDIYFWHKSILYVGAGLSTLLANFQVFFLAMLDIFVFRQKVSKKLWAAILLAVTGLYLLVGTSWSDSDVVFRMGVLYGILTAMMYTGYIVTLRLTGAEKRILDRRVSMVVVTFVACVLLGFVAVVTGESLAIPDVQTGVYLVSYGVLCQAAGWVIIATAIPKLKLTVSGLILLLQPTLAYVWDVSFFGKHITLVELCGALLALTAIYLGNLRTVEKK